MPSMSRQVKQEIDRATLPVPLARLLEQDDTRLIKQGAEAKVYRTTWFPDSTILVKHRFPKRYRHPTLDLELTRQRLTSEARSLVRCIKAGVAVPGLRCVDADAGVLGIEWVEGWSVREVLGGGQEDDALPDVDEEGVGNDETVDTDEHEEDVAALLRAKGVDEDEMLLSIGREIAKMHLAEIIHGDLTTSNMMVRLQTPAAPTPDTSSGTANSVDEEERIPGASRDARGRIGTGPAGFEVVLIDFGLSSASPSPEDRSVDLYVLERAFSSTHPVVAPRTEPHFDVVLRGYRDVVRAKGKKGEWDRVEARLDEVRMRGRKRSMVG